MTEIAAQAILPHPSFEDRGLGGLGKEYLKVVKRMLEAAATGKSWQIEAVAESLAELATRATGAEVGYIRRTVGQEWLELLGGEKTGVYWAVPPDDRWGKIPLKKHIKDCFNGNGSDVVTLRTLDKTSCHSRDYTKHPVMGSYSNEERNYLMKLGSVAVARLGAPEEGPPRFLLFLGHRDPSRLSHGSDGHSTLTQIQPLLDAAFRLAEGVQDRFDKAQQLKDLSEALPPLALAPTGKAFWRGVATILTAKSGFRFDRTMIFHWREGQNLAECYMAIGGMGGDWADRRNEVSAAFNGQESLLNYVQDALAHPEPGTGLCKLRDPLFAEICQQKPLVFDRNKSTKIAGWLASFENDGKPALEAQPAERLSSDEDEWIKEIVDSRRGVFFKGGPGSWPNDEYFAFPLIALDAKGRRRQIGFVLADVSYAPGGHVPGMHMPDLEITSTVLHLITGMWLARQQEEAYTHTLGAMHAIRHHGGKVSQVLDTLKGLLPDEITTKNEIQELLNELERSGSELGKAKRIIEGIQDQRLSDGTPTDPSDIIDEAGRVACNLYSHLTFSRLTSSTSLSTIPTSPWNGEAVRIPGESLRTIMDCILDNAADFAKTSDGKVSVRCAPHLLSVREEGKQTPGKRILITLENDGPAIDPGLAPFIFADAVSTRTEIGHGTGLSTARQIAKAYRGDVVLLRSAVPVTFGIVLPVAASALQGTLSHPAVN
jgi:hypothetical protein